MEANDYVSLKDEGNAQFKSGNYSEALIHYTKALDIASQSGDKSSAEFQSTVHNNQAACYLKLNKPSQAYLEASKGISTILTI